MASATRDAAPCVGPECDVTKPGRPLSRTTHLRQAEVEGNVSVISNPILNKGTNFDWDERREKRLDGLLPPVVESLELQAERVLYQLQCDALNPLQQYEVLREVHGSNQRLFYKVLISNLEMLAPVVYTPTVGEACTKFDRIYRAPLGMYLSAFHHANRFVEVLGNWLSHTVQIIVVTDGGRILGLGDLGTNGMGISIGKISLYVGGAGFHPEHSLPVVLDMGTNRQQLLDDKFYMGEKQPRLQGEEHMAIVEEFCYAVQKLWPDCLIQFEDFQTDRAFAILERMRDKVLCFNDDIQGTGAVVTAGVLNGLKAQGTPLAEARVVFYGAGSSAVGVATMIAQLIEKHGGVSFQKAMEAIYMVDSKGLITSSRGDTLPEHKQRVARTDDTPPLKDLVDIIRHVKPHVLIGLSGAGPSFSQQAVEELCAHCPRPLIFPLSNPTDRAEITAQDAWTWSKARCIFASGSPFAPVESNGARLVPGQANNVFIFPGVGFGAVMARATTVTDTMFVAAARALADYVSAEDIARSEIYPKISQLREISVTVATAVCEEALAAGVARIDPPADVKEYIRSRMWDPDTGVHYDFSNNGKGRREP